MIILVEYCLNKSNETNDQHKKFIWHFLKANFEQNPRAELLNLLGKILQNRGGNSGVQISKLSGYRIEDINNKLDQHIGGSVLQSKIDGLADEFAGNRVQ